eukprot:TRINITY_DN9086_c0_g1_i1.p1 TRINITY_DN9086_c0_g1~~TRINITY_DN9086_c0_g1_i1.p1  ORF type:complete len:325 (+),score=145.16 TRINITY_DN9086_c0_g1_i1:130-1104(+)
MLSTKANAPRLGPTAPRYTRLDKIGEGAFGVVYKAKDNETVGDLVAMKQIRIDKEREGVPCTALREISLLRELKHPNIVRLIDVVHQERKLTLVFEYMEQDLKKYLEMKEGNIEPKVVRGFLQELLQGLSYCHHRSVLHRDLKPQNLLINKGSLKIADFGMGRPMGIPIKRSTHEAVTLWYRAPDLLLGSTKNISRGVDIWSVACIFAEMATGNVLFAGAKDTEQLLLIFQCLGTPSRDDWPAMHSYPLSAQYLSERNFQEEHQKNGVLPALEGKIGRAGVDLIEKFMAWETQSRLGAAEALKHRYFTDAAGSARESRAESLNA